MSTPDMPGAAERYPGEWENEAHLTRLASLARLDRGWYPARLPAAPGGLAAGWQDPAAPRSLDDQFADPSERRQMAHDRERLRLIDAGVHDGTAALRWLGEHTGELPRVRMSPRYPE